MVVRTAPKPIPAIDRALEDYKGLEQQFDEYVRDLFARMVEEYGPQLKGIYRATNTRAVADARALRGTVQACLTQLDTGPGYDEWAYQINEDRIAQRAAEYAKGVVANWRAKIYDKVGQITRAKVERLGGCAFSITGQYKGHRILLEQQMTLNISSRGTLYNQFPARIYVDGKFTPAAKFKNL